MQSQSQIRQSITDTIVEALKISGCYLTSEMGLPVRENMGNHLAYLDNWLKAMENDSRFIFQASSRATKIADYILAFSHKEAEEAEPAIAE